MHKTFLGVCMRLIWLSYFDPHKDVGRVWSRSGDVTDGGMATPCHDQAAQCMKCLLKGHFMHGCEILRAFTGCLKKNPSVCLMHSGPLYIN